METILETKSIDIDKTHAIGNEKHGYPEQPVKAMPDKEYLIMMEERYRIREEGIF
jgi:hypothetical protein